MEFENPSPKNCQETDNENNKEWKIKCPICLGKIVNNSFTESCCHEYCFTCLSQWSKVKAECPMCKKSFKKIMYNVRSNSEFDTYEVIHQDNPFPPLQTIDDIDFHTFRGYRTTQRGRRHRQRLPPFPPGVPVATRRLQDLRGESFRRFVYATNSWVLLSSTQAGGPDLAPSVRDVSSSFLTANPACLHRLYAWLYRDLGALARCSRANAFPDAEGVVQRLVTGTLDHDLSDIRYRELVRTQLGSVYSRYADHFVHEFRSFARSPVESFRDYDRFAQYYFNGNLITSETYLTLTRQNGSNPDHTMGFEETTWTNPGHFGIPQPMVSYNFSLTATDPFVRISHTGLIDVNDINNSLIETYINDRHHLLSTAAPSTQAGENETHTFHGNEPFDHLLDRRSAFEAAINSPFFPDSAYYLSNPLPTPNLTSNNLNAQGFSGNPRVSSPSSDIVIIDNVNASACNALTTLHNIVVNNVDDSSRETRRPKTSTGQRVFPIFDRAVRTSKKRRAPPQNHGKIAVKREARGETDSAKSSFCELLNALPPIRDRVHEVHDVVEKSSSTGTVSDPQSPKNYDDTPLSTLKRVWRDEAAARKKQRRITNPPRNGMPSTSKDFDGPKSSARKNGREKAIPKRLAATNLQKRLGNDKDIPLPEINEEQRTVSRRCSNLPTSTVVTSSAGSSTPETTAASASDDSIKEVYRSPVFEMASFLARLPLIDHQERTLAWARCYTQWWLAKSHDVENGTTTWASEETNVIWTP